MNSRHPSTADQEFLKVLEAGALPPASWGDESWGLPQLRFAWLCLDAAAPQAALPRVRAGMRRNGAPKASGPGYHETLITAWVGLVAYRRARCPGDGTFAGFCAANPDLLGGRSGALGRYYSDALLSSPAARMGWVEPDLRPLPAAGTIRPATLADVGPMLAVYAPSVLETAASFEEVLPDHAEFTARWREVTAAFPWLVFDVDGAVAGYAYASPHRSRASYRWSVDVSIYVARAFHRQGVAAALYTHLLPEVTALGYYNAFAGITLPGEGSVRLHESFGFTRVGVYQNVGYKLGRWWDTVWYQRALLTATAAPDTPLVR